MRFLKHLISFIFYGNVFYAACTTALCIETNLLAGYPLNSIYFYTLIAAATVWFYGMVYYRSGSRLNHRMVAFDWQSRLHWYSFHKGFIKFLLVLGAAVFVAVGLLYLVKYQSWSSLSVLDYFMLAFFPFISVAYSYQILPFNGLRILREAGTIKPFILGFAWAGFVTCYPMIALKYEGKLINPQVLPFTWLFVQNFIYISMLCILFDIKDVSSDRARGLGTLPVKLGIPKTIYLVIVPLIMINILIKILYFNDKPQFTNAVALRLLPYFFVLWAALEVRKQKSTLYYLGVVDGLMLLKALVGIISIWLSR